MVPSQNGQLCNDFKILEVLDAQKSNRPQKILSKQTQTQGTQEHIEHMICVPKKGEESASSIFTGFLAKLSSGWC